MQTFTSPFVVKLKFWGVIAVYGGFSLCFILMPLVTRAGHDHAALSWEIAVLVGFFCLPVLYSLHGLRNASATYELDADGVTKREWGRETRLRWQDIRGYELSSAKSTLTLWDAQGQRLPVALSSLITEYQFRDAQGTGLRDVLEARLTPITAQMQQVAQQGREFRYGFRSPAGALAIGFPIAALLMVCVFQFGMLTPTAKATERTVCNGMCAFFIFGALVLMIVGLPQLLSVLEVTDDAITRRLPWRTVTLPFAHLDAFAVQTSAKDLVSVTLRGDGSAIQFTSVLPNYALLLEFIRARVPQNVLTNQESAKAEMERRQARSMAWQMPIVGVMLGFLLSLLGYMFLKDGTERLDHYNLLAQKGQIASARVTDIQEIQRSDNRYQVYYTLDIGSKHYDGSSYVPHADFEQARRTNRIPVVYLPGDPSVKHAVASHGNAQAAQMIPIGRGMLGVAVSLPFAFGLAAWISYRRKYTAPPAMRRLEQIQLS